MKNVNNIKICCVFNYPSHYRFPIFKAMDNTFDIDWFFGDSVGEPIKQFDVHKLKNFKGFITPHRLVIMPFVRYSGIKHIFSKQYTHYIFTGEWSSLLCWMIIIYAKITGKKVYSWCHGAYDYTTKLHTKIVERLFFSHQNGIFLYGNYAIPFIQAMGCERDRLHIIHNSLDTNLQTETYQKMMVSDVYKNHFNNDLPVVIYIGRIQKRKKLDQLLEAIKLLKDVNTPVNCVVVGSVTNDESFLNIVKQYGLQDLVWFYGPCYDERENGELLCNASVCVSPGNVGLTCMHALSYGCPVVSHNNFHHQMPEFEAIIPNKTGSFFQENDVTDLAAHISRWCGVTEQQRQQCRDLARETIEKEWSVDYQINLLKSVIK